MLAAVRAWRPDFFKARVVEAGHLASLGRTVEALWPYGPAFVYAVAECLDGIAEAENADLAFFRDIEADALADFSGLTEFGFERVAGFPLARLTLEWDRFEGYLGALKAKRRNNVRRRRQKLEAPEARVAVIQDYAPYAARLAELWTQVAINNKGYAHERLTPAYFEHMARSLGDRSHVVAIFVRDRIAAFGLNLIGDDEYSGVTEGLDYSLRDEYDLYGNNMFEAIGVACALGKKRLQLGVTSYDFKTSIGATCEPCDYFVKARANPDFTKA